MFVDASAIVAILKRESGHAALAERIDSAKVLSTSPLAVFESAMAIARQKRLELDEARDLVRRFVERTGMQILPIDAATGDGALDAHARYGKGRHPAHLNFGDCFAYAMAKRHGVPLLYKGDDFARTDLA